MKTQVDEALKEVTRLGGGESIFSDLIDTFTSVKELSFTAVTDVAAEFLEELPRSPETLHVRKPYEALQIKGSRLLREVQDVILGAYDAFKTELKFSEVEIWAAVDTLQNAVLHMLTDPTRASPKLKEAANAFISMADVGGKAIKVIKVLIERLPDRIQEVMREAQELLEVANAAYQALIDYKDSLLRQPGGLGGVMKDTVDRIQRSIELLDTTKVATTVTTTVSDLVEKVQTIVDLSQIGDKIVAIIRSKRNKIQNTINEVVGVVQGTFGSKFDDAFPSKPCGAFSEPAGKSYPKGQGVLIESATVIAAPVSGILVMHPDSSRSNAFRIKPDTFEHEQFFVDVFNVKVDASLIGEQVFAGQPVAVPTFTAVSGPQCEAASIWVSVVQAELDGTEIGYIDPYPFLAFRAPSMPRWVQVCDYYQYIHRMVVLNQGSASGAVTGRATPPVALPTVPAPVSLESLTNKAKLKVQDLVDGFEQKVTETVEYVGSLAEAEVQKVVDEVENAKKWTTQTFEMLRDEIPTAEEYQDTLEGHVKTGQHFPKAVPTPSATKMKVRVARTCLVGSEFSTDLADLDRVAGKVKAQMARATSDPPIAATVTACPGYDQKLPREGTFDSLSFVDGSSEPGHRTCGLGSTEVAGGGYTSCSTIPGASGGCVGIVCCLTHPLAKPRSIVLQFDPGVDELSVTSDNLATERVVNLKAHPRNSAFRITVDIAPASFELEVVRETTSASNSITVSGWLRSCRDCEAELAFGAQQLSLSSGCTRSECSVVPGQNGAPSFAADTTGRASTPIDVEAITLVELLRITDEPDTVSRIIERVNLAINRKSRSLISPRGLSGSNDGYYRDRVTPENSDFCKSGTFPALAPIVGKIIPDIIVPVPLSFLVLYFGLGMGGELGVDFQLELCLLSLKAEVKTVPYAAVNVYGFVAACLGLGCVKMTVGGLILQTEFPSSIGVGFQPPPFTTTLKLDLSARPLTLYCDISIEICAWLCFCVYKARVWDMAMDPYTTNLFTLGGIDGRAKESDQKPEVFPPMQATSLRARRRRKQIGQTPAASLLTCFAQQLPTPAEEDHRIQLVVNAASNTSDVAAWYKVGTYEGGGDVSSGLAKASPEGWIRGKVGTITETFKPGHIKNREHVFFTVVLQTASEKSEAEPEVPGDGPETTVLCAMEDTFADSPPTMSFRFPHKAQSHPRNLQPVTIEIKSGARLQAQTVSVGVGLGRGSDSLISYHEVPFVEESSLPENPGDASSYFVMPEEGMLFYLRPDDHLAKIQEVPSFAACCARCIEEGRRCVALDYSADHRKCHLHHKGIYDEDPKVSISKILDFQHAQRKDQNLHHLYTKTLSGETFDLSDVEHGSCVHVSVVARNMLGQEARNASGCILIDRTPPLPSDDPVITKTGVLSHVGCRSDLDMDCDHLVDQHHSNHAEYVDAPLHGVLYLGHTPGTEINVTTDHQSLSINFRCGGNCSIETCDIESGFRKVSATVLNMVTNESISLKPDVHDHIHRQEDWTNAFTMWEPTAIPDGFYQWRVTFHNTAAYGGALITTVTHSNPAIKDTTRPTFRPSHTDITFDHERNELNAYFDATDGPVGSGISHEAALCLGFTPHDVDAHPCSFTDTGGSFTLTVPIRPGLFREGVPLWPRIVIKDHAENYAYLQGPPFRVDFSAPVCGAVSAGRDGEHAGFISSQSTVCASWEGFYDKQSHLQRFHISVLARDCGGCVIAAANVTSGIRAHCMNVTREMQHRQQFEVRVTTWNNGHIRKSCSNDSGVVTVDLTEPVPPILVTDGALVDANFSALSGTYKACIRTPFEDPESGIENVSWAIGRRGRRGRMSDEVVGALSSIDVTAGSCYIRTGLNLRDGDNVYATFRGCNRAGLCSVARSNGLIVDRSPAILSFDDGDEAPSEFFSTPVLRQDIASSDPESGVATLSCSIWELHSGDTIKVWPTTTAAEEVQLGTIMATLTAPIAGARYHFECRAINGAGLVTSMSTAWRQYDNTPPLTHHVKVRDELQQPVPVSPTHNAVVLTLPATNTLGAEWQISDFESGTTSSVVAGVFRSTVEPSDIPASALTLQQDAHSGVFRHDFQSCTPPFTGCFRYKVCVSGENGAGLWSNVSCSPDVLFVEGASAGVVSIDGAPHPGPLKGLGGLVIRVRNFTSFYGWEKFCVAVGSSIEHRESISSFTCDVIVFDDGIGLAAIPCHSGSELIVTVLAVDYSGSRVEASSHVRSVDWVAPSIGSISVAAGGHGTGHIMKLPEMGSALGVTIEGRDDDSDGNALEFASWFYSAGGDPKRLVGAWATAQHLFRATIPPPQGGNYTSLAISGCVGDEVGFESATVVKSFDFSNCGPVAPQITCQPVWHGHQFTCAIRTKLYNGCPPVPLASGRIAVRACGKAAAVETKTIIDGGARWIPVERDLTFELQVECDLEIDAEVIDVFGRTVVAKTAIVYNPLYDTASVWFAASDGGAPLQSPRCQYDHECLEVHWSGFDLAGASGPLECSVSVGLNKKSSEIVSATPASVGATQLTVCTSSLPVDQDLFASVRCTAANKYDTMEAVSSPIRVVDKVGLDVLDGSSKGAHSSFAESPNRAYVRWKSKQLVCITALHWQLQTISGSELSEWINLTDMVKTGEAANENVEFDQTITVIQALQYSDEYGGTYTSQSVGFRVAFNELVAGELVDGADSRFDDVQYVLTGGSVSAQWREFGYRVVAPDRSGQGDPTTLTDSSVIDHYEASIVEFTPGSDEVNYVYWHNVGRQTSSNFSYDIVAGRHYGTAVRAFDFSGRHVTAITDGFVAISHSSVAAGEVYTRNYVSTNSSLDVQMPGFSSTPPDVQHFVVALYPAGQRDSIPTPCDIPLAGMAPGPWEVDDQAETLQGLLLRHAESYVVAVRLVNEQGACNTSVSSNITVDMTPPTAGNVTIGEGFLEARSGVTWSRATDVLSVHVNGFFDDISPVESYHYRFFKLVSLSNSSNSTLAQPDGCRLEKTLLEAPRGGAPTYHIDLRAMHSVGTQSAGIGYIVEVDVKMANGIVVHSDSGIIKLDSSPPTSGDACLGLSCTTQQRYIRSSDALTSAVSVAVPRASTLPERCGFHSAPLVAVRSAGEALGVLGSAEILFAGPSVKFNPKQGPNIFNTAVVTSAEVDILLEPTLAKTFFANVLQSAVRLVPRGFVEFKVRPAPVRHAWTHVGVIDKGLGMVDLSISCAKPKQLHVRVVTLGGPSGNALKQSTETTLLDTPICGMASTFRLQLVPSTAGAASERQISDLAIFVNGKEVLSRSIPFRISDKIQTAIWVDTRLEPPFLVPTQTSAKAWPVRFVDFENGTCNAAFQDGESSIEFSARLYYTSSEASRDQIDAWPVTLLDGGLCQPCRSPCDIGCDRECKPHLPEGLQLNISSPVSIREAVYPGNRSHEAIRYFLEVCASDQARNKACSDIGPIIVDDNPPMCELSIVPRPDTTVPVAVLPTQGQVYLRFNCKDQHELKSIVWEAVSDDAGSESYDSRGEIPLQDLFGLKTFHGIQRVEVKNGSWSGHNITFSVTVSDMAGNTNQTSVCLYSSPEPEPDIAIDVDNAVQLRIDGDDSLLVLKVQDEVKINFEPSSARARTGQILFHVLGRSDGFRVNVLAPPGKPLEHKVTLKGSTVSFGVHNASLWDATDHQLRHLLLEPGSVITLSGKVISDTGRDITQVTPPIFVQHDQP